MQYARHKRGIGSVEVIIGVTIAALVLLFASHTIVRFMDTGRDVTKQTQALYLAEEGLEMVKHLRDTEWADIAWFSDGTTYYLLVNPSSIATSTSPEVIGEFTRSIVFDTVERDGGDDIVSSGTPDPGARHVTSTVSWSGGSVSLSTVIVDLRSP